ncbi:hypothetical protein [Pseudomonas sp. PSKL.D1]|uniref:hypothetical protein n=1 Tax=Pseudomonas sp. PSKL.D1 TaxID=3029060 RepID=UPI002381931A|nr:hypothetical protein [Pseudomonas sp. PSKL.D1]WDY60388.1 hypothetical protein PVV54_12405 [Pseudomonas sp. PSKL.D1]
MNPFVHLRLGHFLMSEAGADGAAAGASAEPAAVTTEPDATSQPAAARHESLLTDPAAQSGAEPAADKPNVDGEQQQQTQVPEKYEFTNLPEGYTLDEAAAGEWSETFKDLGLTQEQVDKLVAADAKRSAAQGQAYQSQIAEAHKQQVGQWIGQLRADPEFGGAKFAENVGVAQQALAAYGSPELNQFLKETGLGSHPALIKAFHKAGLELGEGRLHRTTTEVPAERSLADRMYPNYAKN